MLYQKNINYQWTSIMMEEWVRLGVKQVVISPGSRSTPLAWAAINNKTMEHIIHFDERGAGFFALGFAKASGQPALLICTSGTALANYHPAIIEAKQSQLPMIIMSADRPPELQNIGANQTIDQIKIYGDVVSHFHSFSCPSRKVSPTYILSQIDQAYYKSIAWSGASLQPGPVHLNCPFREPLAPDLESGEEWLNQKGEIIKKWQKEKKPYLNFHKVVNNSRMLEYAHLSKLMSEIERPLIVLGDLSLLEQSEFKSVFKKIKKGMAIYLETILLEKKMAYSLEHLDLWIKHFSHLEKPDLIIHFGGKIISKSIGQYLSNHQGAYIQVGTNSIHHDPYLLGGYRIPQSPASMLNFLDSHYKDAWGKYSKRLKVLDTKFKKKLHFYFEKEKSLTEGLFLHYLSKERGFF